MDLRTGLLVLNLLFGCIALPRPQDDLSIFFDREQPAARIVGGSQAAAGSHPHMVALTSGHWLKSFICGGSLVTQRSILTAAHCVNNFFSSGSLSSSLRGTVGTNRWSSDGITYNFARNVTHPHYVVGPIKNDIAILITTTEVALTNLVKPVPITYEFIPEGVPSRVAGWGRTRFNGGFSSTLMELRTSTIDGDECVVRADQARLDLNIPTSPPVHPQIEVCTLHSAGVGNCYGDSGSAVTRITDGAQYGIVSWSFPCARGAPDVYVRISAFRPWLEANLV